MTLKRKIATLANQNVRSFNPNQSNIDNHRALFDECSLTHERTKQAWRHFALNGWFQQEFYLFFTMAVESSYLTELLTEKDNLDPSFVHSMRLLTEGKLFRMFLKKSHLNAWAHLHSFEVNIRTTSCFRTLICSLRTIKATKITLVSWGNSNLYLLNNGFYVNLCCNVDVFQFVTSQAVRRRIQL